MADPRSGADHPAGQQRDISSVAPDISQLKALSHPVRLRMLGLLRTDGPATATQLAARLGLNSGATSYHLRQLAQHGFVEEDSARGNNRDRWWRARHESTATGTGWAEDEQEREVLSAFWQAVTMAHLDQLAAAARERSELPRAWAEASDSSDWVLWLTPEQARDVLARVHALLQEVARTTPASQQQAPSGAEQYLVQLHGFPLPGRIPHRDGAA